MLRTIFVAVIAAYGVWWALRGTYGALMLYLWLAYFRPETWLWDAGWIQALNLSSLGGYYLLIRSVVDGTKFTIDLRGRLLFLYLLICLASSLTSTYSAVSWPFWVEFAKAIIVTYL